MTVPDLMILRHGETEWNRVGRMQGALDSPLTDIGTQQAQRQAEILAGQDVSGWTAYASPQGRAMRTAEIALPNREKIQDARLREIDLGVWTGMLRSDIAKDAPHLFEQDDFSWYDHAPEGEGLLALEQRCRTFLSSLSGPSVLVTHGITSRVIRCIVQGLPAEAFETVGGGQGVVYRLREGKSEKLA